MLLEDIRHKVLTDPHAFIRAAEEDFRAKLDALAHAVANNGDERPVVLLSGPSGSGKTTTSHMMADRLEQMGYETHIISLDNYFRTFSAEETELFLRHELDLESPDRVNNELLSEQLEAIMRGETVELPRYDFTTNKSLMSGETIRLHHGEIIIFEGIHALNPAVIGSADDYTSRIYVSVRTRIEHGPDDARTLLHPSKVRLARRLIRDHRERGRTLADVVSIYDSVERGENLYIMPHKHRADFDVDTFVPYELCVYKNFLPESMPAEQQKHPWLTELFAVLRDLPAIDPTIVPASALIREFIGRGK
jgi:uridine kinase